MVNLSQKYFLIDFHLEFSFIFFMNKKGQILINLIDYKFRIG